MTVPVAIDARRAGSQGSGYPQRAKDFPESSAARPTGKRGRAIATSGH